MLLKILANGIRYKKWVIPLTGILNNNDQTKIEIDKENAIQIVTVEIRLKRKSALVAIDPLPEPSDKVEPVKAKEILVLGFYEVDSGLLELLHDFNHVPSNDPFAEDEYSSIEALQRNYHLLSKMNPVEPPIIKGVSLKDDLCLDITDFLKESGLNFDVECWATFNYTQGKIISYNTPTQLGLIESLTRWGCCHNPINIFTIAHRVELPSREKPYSYAEIIQSNYRKICSTHTFGRSGERVDISQINPIDKKALYRSEIEAVLCEDGKHLDIRIFIGTPELNYTSHTVLLTEQSIAIQVKQNTQTATYLLLKSTIRREAHSH